MRKGKPLFFDSGILRHVSGVRDSVVCHRSVGHWIGIIGGVCAGQSECPAVRSLDIGRVRVVFTSLHSSCFNTAQV